MPSTIFIIISFSILSILSTFVSSAPAPLVPVPAQLTARDVYNPHITSPVAGTVWTCGHTATVTWDGLNVPNQVTNAKGMAILVKPDGKLDIKNPLASGFNVVNEHSVVFEVPQVQPGDDYALVLMGDSGNKSQNFTISCEA